MKGTLSSLSFSRYSLFTLFFSAHNDKIKFFFFFFFGLKNIISLQLMNTSRYIAYGGCNKYFHNEISKCGYMYSSALFIQTLKKLFIFVLGCSCWFIHDNFCIINFKIIGVFAHCKRGIYSILEIAQRNHFQVSCNLDWCLI